MDVHLIGRLEQSGNVLEIAGSPTRSVSMELDGTCNTVRSSVSLIVESKTENLF